MNVCPYQQRPVQIQNSYKRRTTHVQYYGNMFNNDSATNVLTANIHKIMSLSDRGLNRPLCPLYPLLCRLAGTLVSSVHFIVIRRWPNRRHLSECFGFRVSTSCGRYRGWRTRIITFLLIPSNRRRRHPSRRGANTQRVRSARCLWMHIGSDFGSPVLALF